MNLSTSFHFKNIKSIFGNKEFIGWGRKRSGIFAMWCHKIFGGKLTLREDGFIRSVGLGVDGSPSFSVVEDDSGIYYDATTPSKLENILNNYDFSSNVDLLSESKKSMGLIRKFCISKYNNSFYIDADFFKNNKERVLVVVQTENDASLKYGLGYKYSTRKMIEDAIAENKNAAVYVKIHPDVLSGHKKSDIEIDDIPSTCVILDQNINPISLLKYFSKVYTKTSGMGMEALILGLDVVCYGLPYYAGWGLTRDKQKLHRRRRKLKLEELFAGSYILYTKYFNPYSMQKVNIIDAIMSIVKYSGLEQKNSGNLYFFGFSSWKHKNIKHFFTSSYSNALYFCDSLEDALNSGLNSQSKIYIWGKKSFLDVEKYASKYSMELSRAEDGFIRSVSLGSDLTKTYSLVVDSKGIYFDPSSNSDLEDILNNYVLDDKLKERSKKLKRYLINKRLSKYNLYKDVHISLDNKKQTQKLVLVIGQVEDDASIQYGGDRMTNLELLKKTRNKRPSEYIVYKAHPDVLVGNRAGSISSREIKKYADAELKEVSLPSILDICDEVHTITSLSGMEALLRGKKVYTYGMPFYAGWGLTHDEKILHRRVKKCTLEELIAASYIIYPRYIHPRTSQFCEIEVLLQELDKERNSHSRNIFLNKITLDRMLLKIKSYILSLQK